MRPDSQALAADNATGQGAPSTIRCIETATRTHAALSAPPPSGGTQHHQVH
ncbi:hypothetical protein HMPREF1550_02084 [Actinomyces sp. oral taxon 877 str. F0543]|nr:hypothetical protein HMPREF1550_02084 [Actinomyces sp. oral taxon 877 str. F0543]